jgi:uncharacterized Fe-S cluster-containing radical SAM superfamily protein
MLTLPFDPLKRSQEVEDLVMKGRRRKYYRLRSARYYGGIATADLVGCNLLCAYCWNYGRNLRPSECEGRFYTDREIATRLLSIARKKGFNRIRLSGAEPILGEQSLAHLAGVLAEISKRDSRMEFVLETNGILIGARPEFAQHLAAFPRLHVRISLKGWDERSFEQISGAGGDYFVLPLKGLKALLKLGIVAWPAIMYELFGARGIERISERLVGLSIQPEELEVEYLEAYPFVLENLRRRSLDLREYDTPKTAGPDE